MKKISFKFADSAKWFSCMIYSCGLCFTLIVTGMACIGSFSGNEMVSALPCSTLLWTLLFSFLTAVAFSVSRALKKKNVSSVVVCAVHFLITYASFLVVYVFGGGASAYFTINAATQNIVFYVIVMSFCFIGIYVVVGLIRLAAYSVCNKITGKNEEYVNLYSDLKDNKK